MSGRVHKAEHISKVTEGVVIDPNDQNVTPIDAYKVKYISTQPNRVVPIEKAKEKLQEE